MLSRLQRRLNGVRIDRRATVHPTVRFLQGAEVNGDVTLGEHVVVCRWAVLEAAGGSIRIGPNTSIGDGSSLYGQGDLVVGGDVMMASGVRLLTADHQVDEVKLIRTAAEIPRATTIGDGVWIGTNVVVLAGVTIGNGAVVGAGAVVTKDVPAQAVVAGVPAQKLRTRRGPRDPVPPDELESILVTPGIANICPNCGRVTTKGFKWDCLQRSPGAYVEPDDPRFAECVLDLATDTTTEPCWRCSN